MPVDEQNHSDNSPTTYTSATARLRNLLGAVSGFREQRLFEGLRGYFQLSIDDFSELAISELIFVHHIIASAQREIRVEMGETLETFYAPKFVTIKNAFSPQSLYQAPAQVSNQITSEIRTALELASLQVQKREPVLDPTSKQNLLAILNETRTLVHESKMPNGVKLRLLIQLEKLQQAIDSYDSLGAEFAREVVESTVGTWGIESNRIDESVQQKLRNLVIAIGPYISMAANLATIGMTLGPAAVAALHGGHPK